MSTNTDPRRGFWLLDPESPWLSALGLLCAVSILIGGPALAVVQTLRQPKVVGWQEARAMREAALPPLDLMQVARGKRLYEASCFACHGKDARGVPNLGRDLIDGQYSRTTPDHEYIAMIIRGRQPGDPDFIGPVAMPPRGGRPDFSDEDIAAILAYVRALQVPSRIGGRPIPEVPVERRVPAGQ